MEKIEELRKQIDGIDAEMAELFIKRLAVCGEIGKEKKRIGMPIEDLAREEVVLEGLKKYADEQTFSYVKSLYKRIFTLSKGYQTEQNKKGG